MKTLLTELPPLSARAVAGLGGTALLFGLARAGGEKLWPPAGLWPRLVLFALVNYAAWMGFATIALLWLTATEGAIVAYTLPVWAALLAWPVLGERPTLRRVAALVVAFAGVAVLVGSAPEIGRAKLPGYALVLSGAILFALGTVMAKRRPLPLPLRAGVFWQVAIGTAILLAAALATEAPRWASLSSTGWLLMAYMAAVPLCLCYLAWFRALALLPASAATVGVLLVPVIGSLSAAAALGEAFGGREAVALLFTLGGIVLAARA